jgi:peptidoglycan/LPS O-acetylase OafA/YrhL
MPLSQVVMRLLSTLAPGDAAVMVFFVLSGHVLWESYRRKDMRLGRDLPDYLSARAYRLFPLIIASGVPLGFLVAAAPAGELVRNMLLLSIRLNGVLWSLQVEVVASVALFAMWGITRGRVWALALCFLGIAAAVPFARGEPAIVFLPAFVLGAGIGGVGPRLWRSRLLMAGGIMTLLFSNIPLGHGSLTRVFEILGAVALVGPVSQGCLPFLRWRVPHFLGAISYPFYLCHPVGLGVADRLLGGTFTGWPYADIAARAVVSIALTVPLAWLLHVLVEVPAQRGRPRLAWASLRAPVLSRRAAARPGGAAVASKDVAGETPG